VGTSISPAALAALPKKPDNPPDLRIPNPQQPPTAGWPGQGGANTPAQLNAPQAVSAPAATPANTANFTPARGTSFESMQSQLSARGVSYQRLELNGDHGDWKFTCAVPNRQTGSNRVYAFTATDPVTAMRTVLDQIEREATGDPAVNPASATTPAPTTPLPATPAPTAPLPPTPTPRAS
jgi:hypothetical protein